MAALMVFALALFLICMSFDDVDIGNSHWTYVLCGS